MSSRRGLEFLAQLPAMGQDLPYSPSLLQTLYVQTSDEGLDTMDDVAETLSRDPALAAKVLATANSAYYGLQSGVTSLSRALAVLGLTEIRKMVLAIGLGSMGKTLSPNAPFDLAKFWRHQVLTATAGALLAEPLGTSAEDMFTVGLLHDIGQLITALYRPKDWAAMVELAKKEGLPMPQAEDRYWGLEHGLVGAMVLSAWLLPPQLTEPVSWHHSPYEAPEYSRQAKALCLANELAHRVSHPEREITGQARRVLDEFNLDFEELDQALRQAIQGISFKEMLRRLTTG